jgi:hypothetical protein
MPQPLENAAGLVSFVPGLIHQPEPRYYLGLDLGQRHDHSALAALHLAWTPASQCPLTFARRFQPSLTIASLHRFPLGTDYDELHDLIYRQLARDNRHQELIVDAGGPGPPIVDRLRRALDSHITIRPVLITGGKGENTLSGGYIGIPRRTLISTLLLAIAARTLGCPEGLPHWQTFEEELVELRGDNTHPGNSDSHDDLVIAVALALSAAIRATPELLPAPGGGRKEPVRCGYVDKPLF